MVMQTPIGRRTSEGAHARGGTPTAGSQPAAVEQSPPLERYLADLQGCELLSAAQEHDYGREIERRAVAHWRVLLSFRRAWPYIVSALQRSAVDCADVLCAADRRVRPSARPSSRRIALADPVTLAKRMQALDTQRHGLRSADAAVRDALALDPGAKRYLARVASARLASDQAKNRLVSANLRLVVAMAKRYGRMSMPLPDLIQEGNLGLLRAVELYDFRRGHRFSTYASWWIRHSLNRALSQKSRLIRIPVHALDDGAKLARAAQRLASVNGQRPSVAELSVALQQPVAKITQLEEQALVERPLSLDQTPVEGSGHGLHDMLADLSIPEPEQALASARLCEELDGMFGVLTPMEASILRFRFGLEGGEEQTLKQIGARYALSRERIRQIQCDALRKLGAAFKRLHPGEDAGRAA